MDLANIDIATKNDFAARYSVHGILVIQEVDLPGAFEPRATDVIFLAVDGNCEVYIDARVAYTSTARHWHDLMRRQEVSGHARLVAKSVDFFSAFRTFAQLLTTAQHTSTAPSEQEVRQAWLQKLGLSGNPTVEQIKKAFRKLALIHHPDRLAGASDSELKAAGERMRGIVEAHHALVRPDSSCGMDDAASGDRHTE